MKRFQKIIIAVVVIAAAALAVDAYRAFMNHSACTGTAESVRTSEREIAFRYKWEWDGQPHSMGNELVHLEWSAYDTEARFVDDTKAELNGTVHYQTADGETIDRTLEMDETNTGEFPMKIKAENSAGKTVTAWAQSGEIEAAVSAVSNEVLLDYVAFDGVCGHQRTGLWVQEKAPEAVLEFENYQMPDGYTQMAQVQDRLDSQGVLEKQ